MLSTICITFLLQSLAADRAVVASAPLIANTASLAMAQQPEQAGRRGGRTQPQPQPTDVRDAMPEGSSPLINPPEVRMIPVQNATADDIERLINSALRDKLVYADPRTNSVIYMGPPGLAQKVVDMIAKIDVPGQASMSQNSVHVQPLKHRRPEDITRQLASTLGSRRLRLAADESSCSIILSGSRADINDAVGAIETLDQETPPVQLEIRHSQRHRQEAG
ncbi:MAG: hypothetical protein IPK83_21545 [Planctomycetes bacterium]|nr:hypothetical protein [Planctomycetota bacterium]